MNLGLSGKRAWVMGGSSGLGRAVAEVLVREGASVAISARDPDALGQAADNIRHSGPGFVIAESLDVTDQGQILAVRDRVLDQLGGLDILVSNHGGPPPGGFQDVDDDGFKNGFDLVLASAFRLTKAVVPAMTQSQDGVIAYLTSSSTKEVIPNLFISNVMRLGVVGMAKTLSKELAPLGIRSLCIAPGRIDTIRVKQLDQAAADRRGREVVDVRAESEGSIPLGRYGTPQEFGDVVAFLCSPRAAYVNGVTLLVDGGKVSAV